MAGPTLLHCKIIVSLLITNRYISNELLSTILKYPGGQFNWWKKPA
jgi:hypothetical protein